MEKDTNEEIKELSYKDYYEFLKNEKSVKELILKKSNEKINTLRSFCNVNIYGNRIVVVGDVTKICTLSKAYKISFKESLKILFGEAFFDELTDEAKEECKKNNLFTKEEIDIFLGHLYGKIGKYEFKRPSSWEELIKFFYDCFDAYMDPTIKDKKNLHAIIYSIKSLIEKEFTKLYVTKTESELSLKIYDRFIKAIDNKTKIDLSLDEEKSCYTVFKNDDRTFVLFTEKEDEKYKSISYSDSFIYMCESYDDDFEKLEDDKESSKLQKKIDKYYEKITNTPIKNLENANLPKYSNKNYTLIIKELINRLNNNMSVDETLLEYYTILQMHYANYFKTKYFDEYEKSLIK